MAITMAWSESAGASPASCTDDDSQREHLAVKPGRETHLDNENGFDAAGRQERASKGQTLARFVHISHSPASVRIAYLAVFS